VVRAEFSVTCIRLSLKIFHFLTIWQILVYYPFVHMILGGGLLAHFRIIDFAGGIVVHLQQLPGYALNDHVK